MSDEDATTPVEPKELEARILLLELRAREIEAHIRLEEAQAKRRKMRIGNPNKRKRRLQEQKTGQKSGQDPGDK